MLFLGSTMLWLGYATAYYGLTQIQGGNWGFLDLALPTHWPAAQNIPRDGSGVTSRVVAGASDVNVKAIAATVKKGRKVAAHRVAIKTEESRIKTAAASGGQRLVNLANTLERLATGGL